MPTKDLHGQKHFDNVHSHIVGNGHVPAIWDYNYICAQDYFATFKTLNALEERVMSMWFFFQGNV